MASRNLVIIGSSNGLVPIWHQAITITNDNLHQLDSQENTSVKFEIKYNDFI